MTLWYLARATGVVALICFTVTTALGALAAGTRGAGMRFGLGYVHRSAAVTGLVLLATHITTIIADSYVDIGPGVLWWPLGSGYRPFAVLVGALALYTFVLVAVAGAARGRLAGSAAVSRRWRAVHAMAYAGWALSVGHGLLAGTDRGTGWMLAIDLACVAAVGFAVVARLQADAEYRERTLTLARAGVHSAGMHRRTR